MSFCPHCGNEVHENAVVCLKCGGPLPGKQTNMIQKPAQASQSSVSLVLGIVGIISAWLFALVGHITSIIGIVFGIKEYKETNKSTGLVLSIIGEVCSVLSSIIGMLTVASLY